MSNSASLNQLSGHAVVTGGSGGIGQEVVRALAMAGATAVSFTYGRNKEAADRMTAELESLGVKTFSAPVDRMDIVAFKSFLESSVAAVGEEVSLAVDTVGISPNTPLEEQTLEEARRVYDVNVHGSKFTLLALASRMKEKGVKGSIVLITSSNGINSQASYSVDYDGSKSAQAHMMRTLAEPFAKGPVPVRVNAVAPGWVKTTADMLPPDQSEIDKETAKIWLGRFADPSEIASVIIFLLSPAASYVVGQNILIDGGYR